jgi:hypothetical protein
VVSGPGRYGNVAPVPEACADLNILAASAVRYVGYPPHPLVCEQLGPSMVDAPTYSLRKVHGADPILVFTYTNPHNANILTIRLH